VQALAVLGNLPAETLVRVCLDRGVFDELLVVRVEGPVGGLADPPRLGVGGAAAGERGARRLLSDGREVEGREAGVVVPVLAAVLSVQVGPVPVVAGLD
jgi:hypothetical protein